MMSACFGSSARDAAASDAVTNDTGANAAAASEEVVQAPTETPEAAAPEPTAEAAPEDRAPEDTAEVEEEPAASPTSGSTEASASEQEPAEGLVFQIDPSQAEARFIVNEVLFGNPNEVTGRTNEVSGTITVDLNDPSQTTVSEIRINARSLATDNRFRNRSVSRMILQSNRDEYQFITFTPAAIEGLPDEANVGDALAFRITGDLKIRDIVKPVTFEVDVTADSEAQISGIAHTTIQRADFELTIPDVDGVADVTEEVRLELEFVALAGE